MTDRRPHLLLAACVAGGVATAHSASAAPYGSLAARYGAPPMAMLRRAHYLVAVPARVQAVPVVPASADLQPRPRAGVAQPQLGLGPGTAHYDHAPDGLDDDPTTFGLVAKF